MLEDKDKNIKVLELELNVTENNNQQSKKKVQEDYQWTGEEKTSWTPLINFASHSSFQSASSSRKDGRVIGRIGGILVLVVHARPADPRRRQRRGYLGGDHSVDKDVVHKH